MYKRYAWNIFATSTVVTFLASIFVFSQTPIYRATATVVANGEQIQADILYLGSADLIQKIVDSGEIDFSRQISDPATQGFEFMSWIPGLEKFYSGRSDRLDDGGFAYTSEYIVSQIQENLTVAKGEKSMWIDISFDSPDQQLSANVANLVARTYLGLDYPENIERTLALSRELELAEQELLDYISEKPGAESSAHHLLSLESELEGLENELTSQRIEIAEQKVILTRLKQLRIENPELMAQDAVMIQDPDLSKTRQKKEELTIRWKEMATRYGSQHLKMIALNAEITETDYLLSQQTTNVLARLEDQLQAMIRVDQSLVLRISDQKDKQKSLHVLDTRTKVLRLDVDTARRNFEVGHSNDVSRKNEFRFSAAAVPKDPTTPRVTLILFSFFLTTGLLMVILIYWKEHVSVSET